MNGCETRPFLCTAQEKKICYTIAIRWEGALSWDLFCKALVKECPQDFVTYFAPNARYVGMRETQLQGRVDGSIDPREIREKRPLDHLYQLARHQRTPASATAWSRMSRA